MESVALEAHYAPYIAVFGWLGCHDSIETKRTQEHCLRKEGGHSSEHRESCSMTLEAITMISCPSTLCRLIACT